MPFPPAGQSPDRNNQRRSHHRRLDWKDSRTDTFAFFRALAGVPNHEDTIETKPLSKAEAFAFRQRLYAWRRSVLVDLADPDNPAQGTAIEWLKHAIGLRANKDWLDFTILQVLPVEEGRYIVRGSITRPCYGPDIVFEDDPGRLADLDLMRQVIARAQQDKATPWTATASGGSAGGIAGPSPGVASSAGGSSALPVGMWSALANELAVPEIALARRAAELEADGVPPAAVAAALRAELMA